MLMAFWQYEGTIRLPLQKVRAMRHMGVVKTRLLSELGREPTVAEIAREMEMDERAVRELMALQEQQVVSLYAFPMDDNDLSLADVVPDTTASALVDDDFSSVEGALRCLPERERLVIRLRYGFQNGQAYTQQEVASLLGVALSTVAMLDRRAQLRLRKVLEGMAS
jgi:RNA polymerase primary sigma factor